MLERIERVIFRAITIATLAAVFASWVGAILMFALGITTTYDAIAAITSSETLETSGLPRDEATVIYLIEALDRFLIGVVLIYFGFGLYGLFIRPGHSPEEMGLPDWLHVDSIGELKQTLAEVIIVILFVLFLSVAFKTFHGDLKEVTLSDMARLLLLPVSILLLAASLKLAELHPKLHEGARRRREGRPAAGAARRPPEDRAEP